MECFAKFFSENFESSTPVNLVELLSISEDEILTAIKRLRCDMLSGPDQVLAFLTKDCADIFVGPLCYLFN